MRKRRLALGLAATGLLLVVRPALATQYDARKAVVVGLGGTGCTLVEKLRERDPVQTVTVDQEESDRRVDLTLSTLALPSLSSAQARLVRDTVRPFDVVVLVAGLGGHAGTYLTPRFAEAARASAISVGAVVALPFGFEGSRVTAAQNGLRALGPLVDRLTTIDNQAVTRRLPDDITLADALSHLDEQALGAVGGQLSAFRGSAASA